MASGTYSDKTSCEPGRAAERRAAASGLAGLLDANPAFSFIRLGDGETWWLLHAQDGKPPPKYRYFANEASTVERAASTSGLELRHYDRFVAALERGDYLDYCDSIPKVREHLPRLRFRRPDHLARNSSPRTSNILFEWTYYELHALLGRCRTIFASAEASLLESLWTEPRYRSAASAFLPEAANFRFHQIRENGRNYSENLDLIKDDLKRDMEDFGADLLLLSLATGAKILCYELASEIGIRAVDFGSMSRALTYSASPGYQTLRNLHNPFLFRVPLEVMAPALEAAALESTTEALLSRLQNQVLMELQPLDVFAFNTTDAITGRIDRSPERLEAFNAALRFYNRYYRTLPQRSKSARRLHRAFIRWRLKKGIGRSGRAFQLLVRIKGRLRGVLQPLTKLLALARGMRQ